MILSAVPFPRNEQRILQDRLPPRRSSDRFRDHLVDTRRPLHSLPAVAPLVLAHAVLTWLFEPPVVAAAANWVQWPLLRLGLGPFEASLVLAVRQVRSARAGTPRSRHQLATACRASGSPKASGR